MKKLFILLLFLATATVWAQDDLPANYTDGWFLATNYVEVDTLGGAIPQTANPTVPSGTTAIAEAITPDITALAGNLLNDPTRIYDYVHDHIRYVHYFGSHKGAEMTLLERSGNDFDQSALLMALLRAAGYSPTYQFGMVSIPYSAANQMDYQHWVGATMPNTNWSVTAALVGNINGNFGYPYTTTVSGDTTNMYFHHIWVQVTVNGTNYTLDPAFKIGQTNAGINIDTAAQINTNNLISDAGGTATNDYVQGLSESSIRSDLTTYTANLRTYIQTNMPNASVQQMIGGKSIIPCTGLNQPVAFTVQTRSAQWPTSTWNYIPTNLMAVLIVTLPGTTNSTNSFYVPGLAGSRLSLVNTSSGQGQLYQEDTQLTNVQTTGGSSPTYTPTLTFQHPFGSWNFSSTNGLSRSSWADQTLNRAVYQRTNATYILLYGYDANAAWLTSRQRQLDLYRQEGYSDTSAQVSKETLNVMGLNWLAQTELASQLLAGQSSILDHFLHRLGRMGEETGKGYYIDVYGQVNAVVPNNTTNASGVFNENQVFQVGGYFASALEHGIIEQLQASGLTAASTVKLLQLANTNSLKIYLATTNNWTSGANVSANISGYGYGSGTTSNSIVSFLYGSGANYVLLPQSGSIQIAQAGSWSGSGFVEYQQVGNNQSQGMVIGGGYNGGYVSSPSATPSTPVITGIDANQTTYFNSQPATVAMPTGTAADPVSMVDGTFQLTSSDIALGGTEPRGLNLTRYYSSARRNTSQAGMAPGWLNSYYCTASAQSGWQAVLGGTTTPQQMAPMLVAIRAALDIYNSGQPNPKGWTMTALIAKWGIDQVINNAVSINLGNQTIQFTKQPDGTFTPPANSTMTLSVNGSGYALQERHGRTFYFGSNTLLTNIIDQYSKSMSLTYNSSNWVSTVTDWKNRTLTFTYTGSNLTSVGDGSRTVHYGYTGGDLISFTDADGNVFTYQYDTNHQIIATLDALSRLVVTNNYDINGHVTTQMTQGATNKLWQVFASGWQTTVIDPMSGQQNYFFDDQSRQTGFQDAVGNLAQTFYDGQDHVVQTVSPRGETNQFVFDSNNNMIESVDALGFSNVFSFDGNNNLVASTDGRGNTTHFGYNGEFSLIGSTNGNGDYFTLIYNTDGTLQSRSDSSGTTGYTYGDTYSQLTAINYPTGFGSESFVNNSFGDVTSHTDARGFTTAFGYNNRRQHTNTVAPGSLNSSASFDSNGNQTASTDARGNVTSNSWSVTRHLLTTALPPTPQGTAVLTSAYDTRDWLASTQNPLGKTTYYTNDAVQRLIATTDPLQRTTRLAYDNDGHQTNSTDAASEQTTQAFDQRGNVTKIVDGAGGIVGKAYDGAGNLTYLTNRNANVWQFQYDGANRLINTISPLSHSTSRVFNNRGLLATNTDGFGQKTSYGWNPRGWMTNRTDSIGTTSYQQDLNGNVTNVSENGKSFQQQFDSHNWLTNYTDVNGYNIGYRRDNNGNVTNVVYPGGLSVALALDSNNRITNVTDWASRKTVIAYDLAGREATITRPNNTVRTTSYDDDGEVTSIVDKLTSQFPISFYTLHYNAAGRADWEFKGPTNHTYVPPTRTMAYDADNRLSSFNSTNVSVDADGNLTYGPGTNGTFYSYGYDARNRLTSAGGVSYAYDAANNRLAVTNGTNVATYVIDPQTSQVLMRVSNTATNYYIYGNGLLYEIDVIGAVTSVFYYHFDVRGSTIAMTDGSGNLTDQFEYSPYGMETYHAGTSSTPFLYNGRYGVQTDNNGLLYMKARFYNPYICRFLNPDPSGFSGGLNLYQFASGNPVCQVDPTGFGSVSANNGQASWISGSTPNNSMYANGTPVNSQNPFGVANNPSYGALVGNGLNNTVSAIGQTIGQGLYDLVNLQFSTQQYNQIANTMFSTGTPANPAATPYIEGALGVSGAATAIAGGAIAWEAAGLPTMNVAVGSGELVTSPIHVAYGVGNTWVNAVGSSLGNLTVSTWSAAETAQGAYFTITGIPVLNAAAVTATGGAAWTCVTAAGSAFVRGWLP